MSICFLCRRSTVKSASRYSFQFNERARPARLKPVAFCLKGRCSIYTHVISEDGKRIAAQLGKAVWGVLRSEEHTSELQSRGHLVCRLLLEKKEEGETHLADA